MKLFISGTSDFSAKQQPPPGMQRLKVFLDKSKDGELFTSQQVAAAINVTAHNILMDSRCLPGYSYRVGSKRYWGKPVTIQQLVKETKV
jgi:hypothetical protein